MYNKRFYYKTNSFLWGNTKHKNLIQFGKNLTTNLFFTKQSHKSPNRNCNNSIWHLNLITTKLKNNHQLTMSGFFVIVLFRATTEIFLFRWNITCRTVSIEAILSLSTIRRGKCWVFTGSFYCWWCCCCWCWGGWFQISGCWWCLICVTRIFVGLRFSVALSFDCKNFLVTIKTSVETLGKLFF